MYALKHLSIISKYLHTKEEIDNYTIILEDFKTPLSTMDRSSREKKTVRKPCTIFHLIF